MAVAPQGWAKGCVGVVWQVDWQKHWAPLSAWGEDWGNSWELSKMSPEAMMGSMWGVALPSVEELGWVLPSA